MADRLLTTRSAVLLVGAALIAGCGSGGSSTTGSLVTPNQKTTTGLTEVHPKEAAAEKKAKGKRSKHTKRATKAAKQKKQSAAATPTAPSATTKKSKKPVGSDLPLATRISAIKRVVPAVAKALGFGTASVQTDGKKATVGIEQAHACAMGRKGPATLRQRLTTSMPWVKPLDLVVKETSAPLIPYAKSQCQPPKPPVVAGKEVFSQSGSSGQMTTKEFTITSNKWTIAWASQGSYIQIFVLKDGKVQPVAISSQKPGSGKQAMKGAGTYSLQITASGDWNVQVTDGG